MADGLNRAMLIGNLGSDPELRFTNNNRGKLSFRMATTESYKDQSGERKEVTHWHNVVLWGARAEWLSKALSKGSKVFVEGRIETRSYDDKDGVKRNITEVVASNLILMDGRRDHAGAGAGAGASGGGDPSHGGGGGGPRLVKPSPAAAPAAKGPSPDDFPPDEFGGGAPGGDDDIPF
ncbi:MAG: single-stranded DNA-binding protein [Deltaproteobacteria bacterium]|nr:single-stranded DNA-binding protein [Deltaproteobacteria bacterium]